MTRRSNTPDDRVLQTPPRRAFSLGSWLAHSVHPDGTQATLAALRETLADAKPSEFVEQLRGIVEKTADVLVLVQEYGRLSKLVDPLGRSPENLRRSAQVSRQTAAINKLNAEIADQIQRLPVQIQTALFALNRNDLKPNPTLEGARKVLIDSVREAAL